MQTVLTALKDIPGVVGSFVHTPQGALVAREMPQVFPDQIFADLGRRLATVGEVVDSQVGPIRELLLKFEGCWLLVRHTTDCLLSVLVADSVNFPALRMAANVALKQVTEKLTSAPPFAPPSAPASAPAPVEQAAAPTKPRRMWRGQVIEG